MHLLILQWHKTFHLLHFVVTENVPFRTLLQCNLERTDIKELKLT